MEAKNNILFIGLVTLLFGLGIGYFIGNRPLVEDQSSMHGAMNGMTIGLEGKTGDELDKAFLDGMIIHHEGAVEMAQTLLKGTKRPELIKLGNDIVTAQTGEIQMMKDWRRSWFNQ
ncbi:MAG: DUF305 domain-containing protein [Candidatus Pacebacteria bacterium]|nr:DUF305 domain-containing protein [Candidatus Paceibacterota bacterium]MBP9832010.1 DUF305 domain-containing protein [Candidatus Paceibacterota bacterium]